MLCQIGLNVLRLNKNILREKNCSQKAIPHAERILRPCLSQCKCRTSPAKSDLKMVGFTKKSCTYLWTEEVLPLLTAKYGFIHLLSTLRPLEYREVLFTYRDNQ